MYSASVLSGFSRARYEFRSLRTLLISLARSRAVAMADFNLENSVRCCCKISRCRARFVDLRADGVVSESRMRARCDKEEFRFSSSSLTCSSALRSSSLGAAPMSDFAANCDRVWKSASVYSLSACDPGVLQCSTYLGLLRPCLLANLSPCAGCGRHALARRLRAPESHERLWVYKADQVSRSADEEDIHCQRSAMLLCFLGAEA